MGRESRHNHLEGVQSVLQLDLVIKELLVELLLVSIQVNLSLVHNPLRPGENVQGCMQKFCKGGGGGGGVLAVFKKGGGPAASSVRGNTGRQCGPPQHSLSCLMKSAIEVQKNSLRAT